MKLINFVNRKRIMANKPITFVSALFLQEKTLVEVKNKSILTKAERYKIQNNVI